MHRHAIWNENEGTQFTNILANLAKLTLAQWRNTHTYIYIYVYIYTLVRACIEMRLGKRIEGTKFINFPANLAMAALALRIDTHIYMSMNMLRTAMEKRVEGTEFTQILANLAKSTLALWIDTHICISMNMHRDAMEKGGWRHNVYKLSCEPCEANPCTMNRHTYIYIYTYISMIMHRNAMKKRVEGRTFTNVLANLRSDPLHYD